MALSNLLRLKPQQSEDRVRIRLMMESGRLIDEEADVVQTQVIAQKARAAIRNRDAVPLYRQLGEDQEPSWSENLLVETGLSPPPLSDSRYVLQDSKNLFKGIRGGVVSLSGGWSLSNKHLAFLANVCGVIFILVAAWLATYNAEPPELPGGSGGAVERVDVETRPLDGPLDPGVLGPGLPAEPLEPAGGPTVVLPDPTA